MITKILYKIIFYGFRLFGYSVVLKKNQKWVLKDDKTIRINIGSGDWECEGWKNLDYPSEWYHDSQSKHKIIPYDIRNDDIPFADNSVDLIYTSHVIEHIENTHIEKLFRESYRVLKMGGGIRITCPDAEFLWQATKANKDYWEWRKAWFSNPRFYNGSKPREIDKLVAEIATPKLLHYTGSINDNWDYEKEFHEFDMKSFFDLLTGDLVFRTDWVGDHINWWSFEKIKMMLEQAGFKTIIRSKYSGSIFHDMKNIEKFDMTHPEMSLYVEAIKTDECSPRNNVPSLS